MEQKNVTIPVWDVTPSARTYPMLTADVTVDVAVVGAGITGITAAYLLAAAGQKVAVIEAFAVGGGSTGHATGNLYATVGEGLDTIKSKHGDDVMKEVVRSRESAIGFIEQQVDNLRIDCEFTRVPWHLFSTEGDKQIDDEIGREFDAAGSANLNVTDRIPPEFPVTQVTKITSVLEQAQFNPLKYVRGLAAAIDSSYCQIFENSPVVSTEDGETCIAKTSRGTVYAKHLIMATHSPKGIYAVHAAMEAKREYVVAAKLRKPLPPHGIYWHRFGDQLYSIRPYRCEAGDFLLVLGESHLVGAPADNREKIEHVEQYLYKHFDVAEVAYRWGAQNYKSADGLPYIGTSPAQKNTFIATGYKADGLVYGTLAGQLISDAILSRENPWAALYDPKRFTPIASAKQVLKENVTVASYLLKDYLFYGEVKEIKEIKAGEGKTLTLDGEKVAVHRDVAGQVHVVSAVCTHMGCILHWNNAEKSWDCPCHGSRFAINGAVLEGPAIKPLSRPRIAGVQQ